MVLLRIYFAGTGSVRVPGQPTTNDWRVGLVFEVKGRDRPGVCVSVTPWGSNRVRWVRLRHNDGKYRSYAPSELLERRTA